MIIFGPIFKECQFQFNTSPKVYFQPNIGYGDSLRLEAFLIGWRPQMNVETSCFSPFAAFASSAAAVVEFQKRLLLSSDSRQILTATRRFPEREQPDLKREILVRKKIKETFHLLR